MSTNDPASAELAQNALDAHVPDGIQAQDALINELEADEFGWDLMIGAAFVRGMRDIGYKSTAFA
ncbi:MAG: hypothetical protein ACREX8_04100, partial [Gammaproteobacteria bacterium]